MVARLMPQRFQVQLDDRGITIGNVFTNAVQYKGDYV